MDGKCCGACRFHLFDNNEEDWVCNNQDSENFGDFTAYANGTDCPEFEERKPVNFF